jgi:hypothetical protein
MAPTDNTVARTLHDLGLAAWFGGSLMGRPGSTGLPRWSRTPPSGYGWPTAAGPRWTPLNLAGIAAHLAGGAILTGANKGPPGRPAGGGRHQHGQDRSDVAALGVTGYARLLGKKLERAGDVPVEGGTTPNPATPEEVTRAQRQLTALQWVIPVLTGAVLVVNARMGEQQRPTQVTTGLLARLLPGH